jgi:tetratricopeptide (TPR) repeat protein
MLTGVGTWSSSGLVMTDGNSVTSDETARAGLNIARDRLALLVNGPLVLLVSPDGARELQEFASDLFDVRAGTYVVDAEAPLKAEGEPLSLINDELPTGELPFSAAELEKLEQSAEPPPPTALADAWVKLVGTLILKMELEQAAAGAEQILRLAKSAETPYVSAQIEALSALAEVACLQNRMAAAEAYIRDATRLIDTDASSNQIVRARRLNSLAKALIAMKRCDEVMALLRESERVFRQFHNAQGLVLALLLETMVLVQQNRLEEAKVLVKEMGAMLVPHSAREALEREAAILAQSGRLETAMIALQQEERICRQLSEENKLAQNLANQALIRERLGDFRAARGLVSEAEKLARDQVLPALLAKIQPIAQRIRATA